MPGDVGIVLQAIANDRPRVFPGALVKLAAVAIALAPLLVLRLLLSRRVNEMRPRESASDCEFDAEYDLP